MITYGDEQNNPILEFIRNQHVELPNLQRVYQLWNAAKLGEVPTLASEEARQWFGHSLFTANVKMYISHDSLCEISRLFSADPQRPTVPGPQFASYQPDSVPYDEPELQIERYSSLSALYWHLSGALDVMTMGMAFLFDFQRVDRRYKPLRMDFGQGLQLLQKVEETESKLEKLVEVFTSERLLPWNGSSNRTGCEWYEDLRAQRNYDAHVGFPMLYMDDGQWRVPVDARGPEPASNLTGPVPDFCQRLFDNTHRFIGYVFGCAWDSFAPQR